jgi:hypothetical protein
MRAEFMRPFLFCRVVFFCGLSLQAAADTTPIAVAQQLFDAMKAHDAGSAAELFITGATMASVNAEGEGSIIPFEKFVERIGSSKRKWLERIWNPKVLEQDTVAVVWAEYDFHLDGKFSHCGIDSFQMLKTRSGWKIAGISDTRQTSGCKPSPLGPVAAQ